MATSSHGRPSFFDDEDLATKFEWKNFESCPYKDALKQQQPLLKRNLTRTHANSMNTVSNYFVLYSRCILQFKTSISNQPDAVLDIANSRMRTGASKPNAYSFFISKNGNTFEFISQDELVISQWVAELRGICVMSTFHEDYKASKIIGKGSFAKVYLVESKTTGKSFAVKALTKENIIAMNKTNAKMSIINEIDIMRCVSHDNIIKLHEVYETEKSIYLVLELIQGKSLQEVLRKSSFRRKYSAANVINMIRSILDALSYLASKGIMHRDLKPENILLERGEKIKIVDFGLATFVNDKEYIFKKCGTPGYIAPEVFKYNPKSQATSYDDRCDVFSAGCILYYMLFNSPFFDATNASETLRMNRQYTAQFESMQLINEVMRNPDSLLPKEGLHLLTQLLELDHKSRTRAAKALEHPYLIPVPEDIAFNCEVESPELAFRTASDSSPVTSPGLARADLYHKSKYEQKDSLYIDVGQPLLNGRIDTMSASVNSNNASLLLAHTPGHQSPGSASRSRFANGGRIATGGKDLFKQAIFKNMQFGLVDSSESPRQSDDAWGSFYDRSSSADAQSNRREKSPDNSEDVSENIQVQRDINISKTRTPAKHPSKLISSSKRYSLHESRSSATNPSTLRVQHARFGEEAKAPR